MWDKAGQCIAVLDALVSLATYRYVFLVKVFMIGLLVSSTLFCFSRYPVPMVMDQCAGRKLYYQKSHLRAMFRYCGTKVDNRCQHDSIMIVSS